MITTNKKSMSRLWLENVPQDKVFWCHDGVVVKNMHELAAALREMSKETFDYHVTDERNDFSSWVRDVIGDVTLANQLQVTNNLATSARRVELRLAWLNKRV